MARTTQDPVIIFLPVTGGETDASEIVVDPVCGRAITNARATGRLLYSGRYHYFCSLGCTERFAGAPKEFGAQ